jgi:hypothetical protein
MLSLRAARADPSALAVSLRHIAPSERGRRHVLGNKPFVAATEYDISSCLGEGNQIENRRLARRPLPAPAPTRKITQADPLPTFRGGMTRLLVLLVAFVTTAHAQGYDPPNAPMDIIAPERPRGMPRQRKIAPNPASPIEVLPLDPPAAEPTPAPAPTPVEITPHPLVEWCTQAANSKTPLCRNVGSSRVQR